MSWNLFFFHGLPARLTLLPKLHFGCQFMQRHGDFHLSALEKRDLWTWNCLVFVCLPISFIHAFIYSFIYLCIYSFVLYFDILVIVLFLATGRETLPKSAFFFRYKQRPVKTTTFCLACVFFGWRHGVLGSMELWKVTGNAPRSCALCFAASIRAKRVIF